MCFYALFKTQIGGNFFMDKLAIAILKALHDGVVTKGEAVEYCRKYDIIL